MGRISTFLMMKKYVEKFVKGVTKGSGNNVIKHVIVGINNSLQDGWDCFEKTSVKR